MIFQMLLVYLVLKQITLVQNEMKNKKIAIVGGGVSGATTALYLNEKGLNVTLFEQGVGLVNGPPMCHLHAGGNLYREIPDHECLALLKESIEFARFYPYSIDPRPTLVAIPLADKGTPEQLLSRLSLLQKQYKSLVNADANNEVIGSPEQYFTLYTKEDVLKLKQATICNQPKTHDEWIIPVAQSIDLEKLKFPLIMINEFGINLFQVAASATLAIQKSGNIALRVNTKINNIERHHGCWQVAFNDEKGAVQQESFDYLINASGFESGILDDFAGFPSDRFIEFKAAYLTRWSGSEARWPEVVFFGERGSVQGMGQFTPYAGGYFQLHGMTEQITLFKDGLKRSTETSAYPALPSHLLKKVKQGWKTEEIEVRTARSISHLAQYIPLFRNAEIVTPPLYGIQQIPGDDPNLRATGVSFAGECYARCEIVKASSVVNVAQQLYQKIVIALDIVESELTESYECQLVKSLTYEDVNLQAILLANERGYPAALAKLNNSV